MISRSSEPAAAPSRPTLERTVSGWRLLPPFLVVAAILSACSTREAQPPESTSPPVVQPQAQKGNQPVFTPVSFDRLSGWLTARHGPAVAAFLRSCARFAPQPSDRAMGGAVTTGRIGDWAGVCQTASQLPPGDDWSARQFFETQFIPYLVSNGNDPVGLFTGYYEPELRGCLRPRPGCTVPLYAKPRDMLTINLGDFRESLAGQTLVAQIDGGEIVPYHDRAAIDQGVLSGQGLELLWVEDRTEAFFLQIQGSGRVALDDGRVVRIGYAGKNGHAYTSIGRELVKRGEMTLDQASMQSIKAWIDANPDRADELLGTNKSYVFFREITGEGPIGAQGVALTPEHSLAVDRRFIPLGAPVWIDLDDPTEPDGRLRRMMVAQDVGGAIKGVVRGDFFWGAGFAAGERAGRMKQRGQYFILLPRTVPPPTPTG